MSSVRRTMGRPCVRPGRASRPVFMLVSVVLMMVTLPMGVAAGGPYTIHGQVVDLNGRPLPYFPMRLNPALPTTGVDNDNVFYRIPGYNDHLTYTDENGEFTMTNVQDYPQNTCHTYRLEPGRMYETVWAEKYPFIRPYLKVNLADYPNTDRIEVLVKPEPAAALKVYVRDKDGQPYNGTLSVSIDTGSHRMNHIARFRDGLYIFAGVPVLKNYPAKIALLAARTARETKEKRVREGKPIGMEEFITDDAFFIAPVQLMPFQWTTVECTVPVPFSSEP